MKVSALLEALPKVGKVKAQEIMTELEIAPTRRLRGLGDRQRKALLESSTSPGRSMNAGGGPDSRSGAVGRVVVLSGPSAVGKSSVVRRLRDEMPDLHFSVSATTRPPRPGEIDGVDYHFVSAEEFQRLIDKGELLEWAEIHGGLQRSGTPARPVSEAAAAGRPVLIEVDLAGAKGSQEGYAGIADRVSCSTQLGGAGTAARRPRHRNAGSDSPSPDDCAGRTCSSG